METPATPGTPVSKKKSCKKTVTSPTKKLKKGEVSNVSVAVRMRPYRDSEETEGCPLSMKDRTLELTLAPNKLERFTFDHLFWSHSNKDGNDQNLPEFADQEKIFQTLGMELTENAWKGYNSSILAYGPT
eukprot:gene8630-7867_t